MKKFLVVALVAVVALVGTMAYAGLQGRGPGSGSQVDVTAFRQFQQETLPLRDEMMAKRLELRNEFIKENPDQNQITKLRTEIDVLRTQIQAAAERQGLPAWGNGPGAGRGYGRGMRGGFGCGNGAGQGIGCGPGNGPGNCQQ